jgi:asparagine synthase (glutamine-hydrolysing)
VSTFRSLGLSGRLVRPDFARVINSSARQVTEGHPVTFAAFKEIPWNLFGNLAAGRSQVSFRTPYLDNEIVALAYRAPASLRASARPALHLIKDNDPILSSIPTDMGKMGEIGGLAGASRRFLSKITFKLDYFYNEGLPHWLSSVDPLFMRFASGSRMIGLHKYLHYRRWFQRELAGYLNDAVTAARARLTPFWNPDFLEGMARHHVSGRRNYVREINAVLTLEAVERLLFRDLPRELSDLKKAGTGSRPKESVLTT